MDEISETVADVQVKNKKAEIIDEHIIEIVSDSGEGAQKAGQSFGAISAKMGNGVWTVEIIPAEIQPPSRTKGGASGIRIRIGSKPVTNMGDEADVVIALNEQVLYARIEQRAFKKGTIILLENKWKTDKSEKIQEQYNLALEDFKTKGYNVKEVPMEEDCLKIVSNAKKGKNMWVLGMLCSLYSRDIEIAKEQIRYIFRKKSEKIIENNVKLLDAGFKWAANHLGFKYSVPVPDDKKDVIVLNGNEALGFGVMASGIEVCSMYPITPATSVSHHLAEHFEKVGGIVHQAEDEIAAIGFAIGSSYSGKTTVTVTSGPGLALKTEFIGLAVMAEVPLVVLVVQRGGPSTGLPTKVEQGDLLYSIYGQPGDTPKIVLAASTIEECFHFIILARQLAEAFRCVVFVLSDTNLATGVQPISRPVLSEDMFMSPIDQSPWKEGVPPFNWDTETGLSQRPLPGQKHGMYTLTGLVHKESGHIDYAPEVNQRGCNMRSRKLATFQQTLKPPKVNGDETGDLLIVGWGSTRGAIEEAVEKARKEGMSVSSVHIRFLSPLEPGLKKIFTKFKKVMTVEINYSDEVGSPNINEESRRYAQLATLLRLHTLMDIDCYSNVHGQPLRPGIIHDRILKEFNK